MRHLLPRRRTPRSPPEERGYERLVADRLRADPGDPDALFTRAALLVGRGDLFRAIDALNDLAKAAPEYPGLWRFKATVYAAAGQSRLASLCAARGANAP